MRAHRLWERLVLWFIFLPAVFAGCVGLLLLPWSLLAWLLHVHRIVSVVPDWELGLGLAVGGFAAGLISAKLAKPSGEMPVRPRDHDIPSRK